MPLLFGGCLRFHRSTILNPACVEVLNMCGSVVCFVKMSHTSGAPIGRPTRILNVRPTFLDHSRRMERLRPEPAVRGDSLDETAISSSRASATGAIFDGTLAQMWPEAREPPIAHLDGFRLHHAGHAHRSTRFRGFDVRAEPTANRAGSNQGSRIPHSASKHRR